MTFFCKDGGPIPNGGGLGSGLNTSSHPRTRSIEPPLYGNRSNTGSGAGYGSSTSPYANTNPYQTNTLGPSPRGNPKVVYPIPVTRSATESLGIHKPSSSAAITSYCRDMNTGRLTPNIGAGGAGTGDIPPGANRFEHAAEFYSKDDCEENNNDYYYSASYSFSTIF